MQEALLAAEHLSSPAPIPSDGHSPSKPFEIKALYRHQWDDISCQTVSPKNNVVLLCHILHVVSQSILLKGIN